MIEYVGRIPKWTVTHMFIKQPRVDDDQRLREQSIIFTIFSYAVGATNPATTTTTSISVPTTYFIH